MKAPSCYVALVFTAILIVGCNVPPETSLTPEVIERPNPQTEPPPLPVIDPTPVIVIGEALEVSQTCLYDAQINTTTELEDIIVSPRKAFIRSWVLRNTGACDWEDVTLVFVSGEQLGGKNAYAIPQTSIGEPAALSLELIAPLKPGQYQSVWRLQAPDGRAFGPDIHIYAVVQATETSLTPQAGQAVISEDGCVLDADFVTDVTVPDGSALNAGVSFTKIWRMQNIGTCKWGEGYSLVYAAGSRMGGQASIPVPPTAVGATADIAIELTAPAKEGGYTGWWKLQTPEGTPFGVWPYVRISVVSAPANTPVSVSPAQTAYSDYIHNITTHAREIYLDGQARGNRSNVFSKVGDSITDTPAFLVPIGNGKYKLQGYTYLQPVITYFSTTTARTGNSFNNISLSAVSGWNSFDMGNPDKVAGTCQAMTPLQCEYSLVKPSLSIIMIGTNDASGGLDIAGYHRNIQAMVEVSIAEGVIPVLSTIPHNQGGDARAYNGVITTIATTYNVPWMDFHDAIWDLPNHGISDDGVHPSVPPTGETANFSTDNLQYGHTVRNLLVLHVLDVLWRQALY